jgi:hypothetical protein
MGIYSLLPKNLSGIKVPISREMAALIEAHEKALAFVSDQITLLMAGNEEEKESAGKFLEAYYGDMSEDEDFE